MRQDATPKGSRGHGHTPALQPGEQTTNHMFFTWVIPPGGRGNSIGGGGNKKSTHNKLGTIWVRRLAVVPAASSRPRGLVTAPPSFPRRPRAWTDSFVDLAVGERSWVHTESGRVSNMRKGERQVSR